MGLLGMWSQVGDLLHPTEEVRRRKGFGKLIPGHGGVLDRFDALVGPHLGHLLT